MAKSKITLELPEQLVRWLRAPIGQVIGVLTIPGILALVSFRGEWVSSSPFWLLLLQKACLYTILAIWACVFSATLQALSRAERMDVVADAAAEEPERVVRFLASPAGRVLAMLLPLGLVLSTVIMASEYAGPNGIHKGVFLLFFVACYVTIGYAVSLARQARLRNG